jgi:glycosyltransferase involved in cell wall biosynthesis
VRQSALRKSRNHATRARLVRVAMANNHRPPPADYPDPGQILWQWREEVKRRQGRRTCGTSTYAPAVDTAILHFIALSDPPGKRGLFRDSGPGRYNDHMRISVVTPSFNQAQFIERTIRSVLEQRHGDVEHIVVDGGSTDGTLEILTRYTGSIIWVSEKDRGQAHAINKGLALSTGEIVAWLNSDDTYETGALVTVARHFMDHPGCRWAYGKCRIVDEGDREIRSFVTWYKNLLLAKYSFTKLLAENFISQPGVFWRRSLLDEIGYLSESEHFCMDYEYWLRIGSRYPAGVIREYLANFRYHRASKSGSVDRKQFQDELRIARGFGSGHPVAILLHTVNYYKIVSAYKILEALGK